MDTSCATLTAAGGVPVLIASGGCRLGRDAGNDFVVTSPAASRFHAVVQADDHSVYHILDLGSANGTFVNDRRVKGRTRLAAGDVIAVAELELVFRSDRACPIDTVRNEPTRFVIDRQLVSVMVLDLIGSTALACELGEARLAEVMGDLFRRCGEAFEREGCWAQKYIGDAVMGVWQHRNHRLTPGDLATFLELANECALIGASVSARHGLEEPLAFGVGLNTGYAALGNMGGASASDFTAMGDTVNKAFRLEAGTRALGCDLLMSESCTQFMQPALPVTLLPQAAHVPLKGFIGLQPVMPFNFDTAVRAARAIHESFAEQRVVTLA